MKRRYQYRLINKLPWSIVLIFTSLENLSLFLISNFQFLQTRTQVFWRFGKSRFSQIWCQISIGSTFSVATSEIAIFSPTSLAIFRLFAAIFPLFDLTRFFSLLCFHEFFPLLEWRARELSLPSSIRSWRLRDLVLYCCVLKTKTNRFVNCKQLHLIYYFQHISL